jgi:TonB family protein
VLIGPRFVNQRPEGQPASAVSPERPAENSSAPSFQRSPESSSENSSEKGNRVVKLQEEPAAAAKPSARKPGISQNPAAVARLVEPAPLEPALSAAEVPVSSSRQGAVRQQVEPSVSRSARGTIRGTIKVRVKVEVDPSGNVKSASFVSAGPSKYFARQAMQAAQQWKFVPAQGEDSRSWIVRFGFRRSGTDADLEPTKP